MERGRRGKTRRMKGEKKERGLWEEERRRKGEGKEEEGKREGRKGGEKLEYAIS